MHLQTHLQFEQANAKSNNRKRACKANAREKEIIKNAPPNDKR